MTDEIPSTARAFALVADKLPPERSQSVLQFVLRLIQQPYDAPRLQALGNAGQALARQLTPAQCATTLQDTLKAITSQAYPDQLNALAALAQVLAAKLDSTQAESAFVQMLKIIEGSGSLRQPQLQALTAVMPAVATRLTTDQARDGLTKVLTGIRNAGGVGQSMGEISFRLFDQLQPLTAAAQALAENLNDADRGTAADEMHAVLAWSMSPELSTRAARALVAILPRNQRERSVQSIVELLKYPTAAGDATNVLLEALKAAAPEAPGAAVGLEANVAWVARAYPAIDLSAPPACPPPRLRGLSCPTVTAH